MPTKQLADFAKEDLTALKDVRTVAAEKAAQAGRVVFGPQALGEIRRQQHDAYREISAEGFSVRIDAAKEDGAQERFYLTKARQGLIEGDLHVISWTAPLARLRVLQPGEDEDLIIRGRETSYTLSLKAKFHPRTDDLENARYETREGVVGYSSAKELLSGAAGAAAGTANEVAAPRPGPGEFGLREIIFETDRIQDDHLRMPLTGHLVIEGAPGSGKTSIALQRAVYVIEEQYDELSIEREKPFFTDETTLVITYNEILVHYLERLLKELRIPQVPVRSVSGWMKDLLDGAHALQSVKRERIKDSRPLSILKTNPWILEPLRAHLLRALQKRWDAAAKALRDGLDDVFGSSSPRRMPYLNEFEQGARQLRGGRVGLSHLVGLFRVARDDFSTERDSQQANAVRGVISRCATETVDYGAIYTEFLQSEAFNDFADARANAGDLSPTSAQRAVREARKHAAAGYIRKNDLPLIAWIVRWLADDVPATPLVTFAKPWERMHHLVMDEVQDLSPVECRLLLEMVEPRHRCVTAVGDLMQRLNYPGGLPSWPSGGFVLNGSGGRVGVFRKNYRQTTELGKLAADYYRAHFGEPVPFEARLDNPGAKPVLLFGSDVRHRLESLADRLVTLRQENPTWSIVALCDDDELRETASKVLKPRLWEKHIPCARSKAVDLRNSGTIHIAPTLHTKGLEFDCVCILEPGRVSKKMTTEQLMRNAYVAITRAGKHLVVTSARELHNVLSPVADHFERITVRE